MNSHIQVRGWCHLSLLHAIFILETRSLTESEFSISARQAASKPPTPGLQALTTVPGIYVGARHLNWSPHAYVTSTLPTEPSSHHRVSFLGLTSAILFLEVTKVRVTFLFFSAQAFFSGCKFCRQAGEMVRCCADMRTWICVSGINMKTGMTTCPYNRRAGWRKTQRQGC